MIEEKEKILNTAENIFLAKGFYRTTVDDLAKSLRMSKKTIYKHFPNKMELVASLLNRIKESLSRNIELIVASDKNSIEKLHSIFKFVAFRTEKIKGPWLEDIQTHSPQLWKEVESFRNKVILNNIIKIIKSGQEEGMIVEESPILLVNILLSAINGVVNPEFLINTNISVKKAAEVTIFTIMNGMMTPKGRRLLKKIKGKSNEE